MGKFIIRPRPDGQFHFNLKASNGETILTSEGYTTRNACLNGIESVRRNADDDSRYERKKAANGKSLFNLKSSNGQVIGTSQMYESDATMESGIASVRSNASGATVEDASA